MRPTSWFGCHTICLTSCVWEFITVTHSYSSSSSTGKHTGKKYHSHTQVLTCACQTSDLGATLQFDTNLPRPRHSCLGYMLPADSPKEPMPHIWPHFRVLPTRSNSGRQAEAVGQFYQSDAYLNVKTKHLISPQNHFPSFSRGTWLHQSWQKPSNSRRETTPIFSQCAGVHPEAQSCISKSHLKENNSKVISRQTVYTGVDVAG